MKRTQSQYARLMELDRLIRAGKHPNCLTFGAEWGVSAKTVQRDIDFLRDQCGAPIEYDREHKGFRYTDASWWLPALPLTEADLLAVLLAARVAEQYRGSPVARQVSQVFTKLAEVLPGNITLAPELLYNRFTFTAPPARPLQEEVWTPVVRGLLARHTVRLVYRPFGSGATRTDKESRVNPCHIANLQGEWYLFGVHAGHSDVRQFAMGRIESAAVTDDPFTMPPGFDARKLLEGVFARFTGDGKPMTVQLLFDAEVAEWVAERQWHPGQTLKTRKSGDVELSFPARGLYEVQRWVLAWGSKVRVLAPAELAGMVRAEVEAMARKVR